jgi:hypothetical protein
MPRTIPSLQAQQSAYLFNPTSTRIPQLLSNLQQSAIECSLHDKHPK